MIIGSIYYIAKDFGEWNFKKIIFVIIGILIGLGISFLTPAKENDNLWFVFICGIIGVSGMTLPGLSGSFILILLGNYVLLLVDSVNVLSGVIKDILSFNFDFFKTPKDTLKKYKELSDKVGFLGGKKRKKTQREMTTITQSSKIFMEEYKRYISWLKKLDEAKKLEKTISNIDCYVSNEIAKHLTILQTENFIESGENYKMSLTEKGKMATNINEVHCLAMAEMINDDLFDSLDVYQLVSLFSIFCDMRLSDENKIYSVGNVNCDDIIKSKVKIVKSMFNKYYDYETKHETEFMFNYNIQYDLIELVYNWSKSEDSERCQHLLKDMEQWDIFIGNFSKAILKICNIASELENVCKMTNKYDLLKKIKDVPGILQKFMITNSSLYI